MKHIRTNSFEETQAYAREFAERLHGGEVLCLYGDLGHGKTTFVQGLAKGLGISGKVISPTFIIMRSYRGESDNSSSAQRLNFYHVDLYRLTHEQEIIDLGLLDIIGKPENIVAIEWPEKMGKLLPKNRIDILLDYKDEDGRLITINDYR